MGSQWRRREKEANKETRGQRRQAGRKREDERKKRAQQNRRRHQESRAYEGSHDRTETNETEKTWGGGGEELSVGSTSTDLFPQDVFSSVAKDGCRTCSPVFRIKTRTPALCCRGSAEEHEEDHAFLQIGFAVEQSARARPCTPLPLV